MAIELSRRQILVSAALAAAAFSPVGKLMASDTHGPVDAGPMSGYATEGVYPQFQPQGFFVIRKGNRVVAQSSLCTHKGCKLSAASDGFTCKCHGSTFAADGKVTRPPAKKDLPRYAVSTNDKGHLMVDLSRELDASKFESPSAFVEAA